eukprot:m.341001 g.341001  ORF g.341001 m.341001 type:complete len:654 (-) comp19713_c0_seq1:86-2047(-)
MWSTTLLLLLVGNYVEAQNTLHAKAWAGSATKFNFPEMDVESVKGKINNAICFPGGGSRAYTSALGVLRALNKLGVMDDVRYISSISGGNWAGAAYTFRENEISDDEFLGDPLSPSELTVAELKKFPSPGTMSYNIPKLTDDFVTGNLRPADKIFGGLVELTGQLLTADDSKKPAILQEIAGLIQQSPDPRDMWMSQIQYYFFTTLGIPVDKHMALNTEQVQEIKSRNNHLQDSDFTVARSNQPFLIMGGTIVGPAKLAPIQLNAIHASVTSIQMTPMYIGSSFSQSMTYESSNTSIPDETLPLGGFVESFAFSANAPSSISSDVAQAAQTSAGTTLTLEEPSSPFALAQASGISSYFIGDIWSQLPLPIPDLVPRFPLFPVEENAKSEEMLMVDGGVLENTGLLAMLQRKVEHVTVFDCSSNTLNESVNLKSLFGMADDKVGLGFDYTKNTVFTKEDYQRMMTGLNGQLEQDKPAVFGMQLTTKANTWWGIPDGQSVHLTWVYYEPTQAWLGALPKETQQLLDTPELKPFPRYPTANLSLTQLQTKMLSQLTTSIVMNSSDTILKGLGLSGPSTTQKPGHKEDDTPTRIVEIVAGIVGGMILLAIVFIAINSAQKNREVSYTTMETFSEEQEKVQVDDESNSPPYHQMEDIP